MKKGKQILAILGIVLLVALYLSTLVCALLDNSSTMAFFKASIYSTIVLPVLIWAYSFIFRLVRGKDATDKSNLNNKDSGMKNTTKSAKDTD